jgi:aminoglycoside phosphotransferase (APT) family kinase protein
MTIHSLEEQLRLLLRQTFGSKVELADYRVSKQRPDYLVLLARLLHPGTAVVIKLAGPAAQWAGSFERTAWLHRLVAQQTNVPVAEVLAVDASYQIWPWRYLIMTYLPGQEWSQVRHQLDPPGRVSALRQLGQAVAALHALHFPAFGELVADGSVVGGSLIAALQSRAQRAIRHPRLQQLFLEVLDQHSALFADGGSASLCHDDLHGHNLLFDVRDGRWRLAAVLDFEKAWAGPAEADLARLELWTGMTGPSFWQGYQTDGLIDSQYSQRRPIHQLFWCLEYAQPTPKHLGTTERVCRELGVAWSGRFEGME